MLPRILVLVALGLAVGAFYWTFSDYLTLDRLVEQESRLREFVNDSLWLALLAGFVLYVATSLVPGTAGKAVVYGWLFGFWFGMLIVNVALTIAAVITFLAIRFVFQELAHERLGPLIGRLDNALSQHGAIYLLTLRLLHAPYSLTNYVAGATTVRTRTFWWTTQVGMLPGNAALVLAGSQLPSLSELAREGVWGVVSLPLLLGLSATAVIPIAVRAAFRRWRPAAAELASKGPLGGH